MGETEQYSLRDGEPPKYLELAGHRDRVARLIDWLQQRGINVASTRIPKYKRFLDSLEGANLDPRTNEEDRIKFDELLYSLRELHELMWIQKGIDCSEPHGIAEILKVIIGGHTFARDDQDTTARNFQFELRIASYFLQKGYAVDLSGIADVVAKKDAFTFCIECKRLASATRIAARVKEAAKQLQRRIGGVAAVAGKFGIAAFDVTRIAFPHQGLTWGLTNEHCKQVIQDKLRTIAQTYDFEGPFKNNKNMIGIWLQIHIPSLLLQFGLPMTRFSSIFLFLASPTGSRARAFAAFQNVYEVTDTMP